MSLDLTALETLLDVIGGEKESLVELIESFEIEGPKLMHQMNSASAASNLEELRRASHTMKSSARDFGAAELSRLCEQLEHRCREGDLSSVPDLVRSIEPEFILALTALSAYKANSLAD